MGTALRRASWVSLVGLLVVGCGGGGGGDGGLLGLLAGPYHFVGVDAHTETEGDVQTQWGTITSNGAGLLDATTMQNEDTSVGGPNTETGIPYTIGGDRALTIVDPSTPGASLAVGRIAASGAIAALGSLQDGQWPGLYLALRRGGTFSDASLNGDYAMCVFLHEDFPDLNGGDTGGITFDGAGGATGGVSINRNGALSGSPFTATYSVDADGGWTLTFGPASSHRGGILAGGNVAVTGGVTSTGKNPMVIVFVRLTTGATNGLLSGSYLLTGIEYDVGEGEYRSVTGTFTADGSGNFDALTRENAEGVVTPSSTSSSGTYAVSGLGGLVLITPGGSVEGAVSPDGSFAVAGGATSSGDNPMLFVLLR